MTEKSATAQPHPSMLLTAQSVAAQFHTIPITLHRWVAAGKFPKSIRFGRRHFWLASDIEALLVGGAK